MNVNPVQHFAERHYRAHELAEMWGVSVAAARALFRNHPEVVHYGRPVGTSKKRAYTTLLIPESVAMRVYAEMVRGAVA